LNYGRQLRSKLFAAWQALLKMLARAKIPLSPLRTISPLQIYGRIKSLEMNFNEINFDFRAALLLFGLRSYSSIFAVGQGSY